MARATNTLTSMLRSSSSSGKRYLQPNGQQSSAYATRAALMMRRCAWSSGSWTWKSSACIEQEPPGREGGREGGREDTDEHASAAPFPSLATDAPGFFSPGCTVAGGGLRCCTIHLHEHALAHALSDRALSRGRNTLAGGRWGVSRHRDDRRPAPLALGVLARAGGLRRDDPRHSGNALAADGDSASPVPALVQSVSDGRLLDRGRHCRVDAPALSASWGVGDGEEEHTLVGYRCRCRQCILKRAV